MAITISGQNNNDKILASDGVLDSISGLNVVGVMTATTFDVTTKHTANHIDVGSSIQLGNAGIITATTLIGNVTGNVNSTSHLLLQISGSEKFRVGNGGQLGIGGANYGTSGQVLTSGGSGSAATWSTVSGTTINNNADNRVITGSGSANTLNGESNVLIDSNGRLLIGTTTLGDASADNLNIADSGHCGVTIRSGSSNYGNLFFTDLTSGDQFQGFVQYNHSDNSLKFGTNKIARINITSGGNVQLPTNGQELTWGASQQMKFYFESSEDRMYLIGDGAYGMAFRINGGNRLEINKTTGDIIMQGASSRNFQWDNSEASLYLTDSGSGSSARLKIGSGQDLQLYHDTGGANHITCATNRELKISANKHTFYDYTGVTKRMEIDASGYVTAPNAPSFHAVGMSGSSYDNGTMTGSGSGPSHNIGNHYNGSTGIFTAPVAGRYLTGCGVLVENGSGRLEGNISKNNSQTVANFNGTGTTYDGPTATAIVNLAANDTLRVKRQSGNAYNSNHGQHYFFAHLIG